MGAFYLVIHGHFYQPPREDPWTGEIERQDSAYPFHDWNERINSECYTSNAFSRVLDEFGRIERVVNNYEYISFNFGPTLLYWMEKHSPETYKKIIEADEKSRDRNEGHGNAIAQIYNHIIMPLANDRDKYTQIEWAIKDFKNRFGRDPEGMWLSETAVNDRTLQMLIDFGIKFTILSPHQAEIVKPIDGEKEWIDVSAGNIDISRPYLNKQPNGNIAIFFYHGGLSHRVSFEHLLRNADNFRNAILSEKPQPQEDRDVLLSIATDGEIYGHHEPYADMCLSRLIVMNEYHRDFVFTNFAHFLEKHPPEWEVRLKAGNMGLGTSWSCAHGVDRWWRDCGCTTGSQPGWNQKWRTPLRNAFDYLRDTLYGTYEKEVKKMLKGIDPQKLRNAYFKVVFARNKGHAEIVKAREEFLREFGADNLPSDQKSKLLRLLESQFNAMLMYTSCGWFFADISGIETVQDIKYSARAIHLVEDLLPPSVESKFLEILSGAKSNIPHFYDGAWIYKNWVKPLRISPEKVVNQFAMRWFLTGKEVHREEYLFNYVLSISEWKTGKKGSIEYASGLVKLEDDITSENGNYMFYVFRTGPTNVRGFVRRMVTENMKKQFDEMLEKLPEGEVIRAFEDWFITSYSLHDVRYDHRQEILRAMFSQTFSTIHQREFEKIDDYITLLDFYTELSVPLPQEEHTRFSALMTDLIEITTEKFTSGQMEFEDALSKLERLIKASRNHNLSIDTSNLERELEKFIKELVERVLSDEGIGKAEEVKKLTRILEFTGELGINFDRRSVENRVYDFLHTKFDDLVAKYRKKKKDDIFMYLKNIIAVAERLNLSIYKFLQKLEGEK